MAKLNAYVSDVEKNFLRFEHGFEGEKQASFAREAVDQVSVKDGFEFRKFVKFADMFSGLNVIGLQQQNVVAGRVWRHIEGDYFVDRITPIGRVGSLNEPMLREGKFVMLLEKKARVSNVDRQLTFTDIIRMATSQIKQSLRYFVSIAMPEGIEV